MRDDTSNTPRGALATLRIIWAALLAGQIIFLLIVIWLIRQPGERPPLEPQLRQILLIGSIALLLAGVPLGYFVRWKMYEKGRGDDGKVARQAYAGGNIILLALCEGASLFTIVAILLTRQLTPFIYVTLIAMAVQAINFPTGAALGER